MPCCRWRRRRGLPAPPIDRASSWSAGRDSCPMRAEVIPLAGRHDRMIRIAITQAAFDAIPATLPLGSVSYDNAVNERGEYYVWLPPNVVDRLRAQRGPGRELQRRHPPAGRRSKPNRAPKNIPNFV